MTDQSSTSITTISDLREGDALILNAGGNWSIERDGRPMEATAFLSLYKTINSFDFFYSIRDATGLGVCFSRDDSNTLQWKLFNEKNHKALVL